MVQCLQLVDKQSSATTNVCTLCTQLKYFYILSIPLPRVHKNESKLVFARKCMYVRRYVKFTS